MKGTKAYDGTGTRNGTSDEIKRREVTGEKRGRTRARVGGRDQLILTD